MLKGEWVVPSATAEIDNAAQYSLWVGLDGDGTPDLVQAGTGCSAIRYPQGPGMVTEIDIATYFAWTQFLPQQPQSQIVSSFWVSPGDQMHVEVWIADAGSGPSLSGFFGVFLLMNLTTPQTTSIYTPVGTTRVIGTEAVWIMERPTILIPLITYLSDLANYGSATMSNAYARKANSPRGSGYVAYFSLPYFQFTMSNFAGTTLSTVTPIDSSTMRFDWQNFN
jgi:hypothetical protein